MESVSRPSVCSVNIMARFGVILLITVAAIFGQTVTTGDIAGVVIDSSGAVVPHATVLLKSLDTGESRSVKANEVGAYRFTFVRPGSYQISSTSMALNSDAGQLIVAVGQVEVLNLVVKPGKIKELVLVTDAAPLLNTENANVTYSVTSRQLELLPLPGGDLVAVAYSMPGVVINNRYGTGNFSSQGLPSVSNLFTVNGIDDMDPYFNVNNSGTNGLLLGANEIREASIIQNAYEGQYGRQAGAQVNYISKSGANAYHGNLLYNYNGARMNANEFFANATGTARSHRVSNQYAAALGGRIVKDKLFFFVDTEGLRNALAGYASVVSIPSQALQTYSLRTINPEQARLYRKAFDLFNAAPGRDRGVAVTSGNGPLQDNSGRLGCGALAGTPTGTGGTFGDNVSCAEAFGANVANQIAEWLLSTRVDYNLSSRQRMFFRFKTNHGFLPVFTSAINPVFNSVSMQPDYEGQLNHTFVITPRLVNNFVGSASYSDYVSGVPDLPAAQQAFPFRFNIPDGGANGSFGMASLGAPAMSPTGRRTGQLQIVDDFSYAAGNHALKAGLNCRYNREADLQYAGFTSIGRFNFFGLDEFARGTLDPESGSNYAQRFAVTPVLHLRLYNMGFYVQDQWALTPRLKITATIRFDRTGNPYCQDNCFARLTSPFPDLRKGMAIPYNQSIGSGLSHAFYKTEPLVYQPRLSLVYSPAWSKGTVLRGGIGIFSDLYPAFFAGNMAGNPPDVFLSTIRTGLVDMAGTGSAPAIAVASATAFERQFAGGATLTQLQQAIAPATFSPPDYYSLPATLKNPKYVKWSFELQRQLGATNVFSMRYSGNHGSDIFLLNPNVNADANPALYPNGFGGLPAAAPDSRFGVVSQLTNNGYSNYHALTTTLRRAFGSGFEGQIGYTWSHALDTTSNGGLGSAVSFSYDAITGQIDPYDVRSLNYSSADYDVRQNLTADFIWELPIKTQTRPLLRLLAGWSLGARMNAHSGTPFTVYNGRIGGRLSPSFGGIVLADVLGPNIHTSCGHFAINAPCFTAGEFATTGTQMDFGNMPRNSFRGPGYFNVDASVYKTITIQEGMRITFGASAYNVLNHPNFVDPSTDVSRSGLGLIQFTVAPPSSPYGLYGGPTGRTVVVTGKFAF